MSYLPKTSVTSLRGVLLLLLAGCIFEFVSYFRLILDGSFGFGIIGVLFWPLLAVGLWLLHPLARSVAVLVLWIVVIVVPIGAINPFSAMNDYGPDFPNVLALSVRIFSLVAVAVFALHILGKYKSEFKFRARKTT